MNSTAKYQCSFLPFEPTDRRVKVSLYQLINDLLANLQPLASNRNNVLHNGVPQGLCFAAQENLLAFNTKLRSLSKATAPTSLSASATAA
jgi:hypothetical protein